MSNVEVSRVGNNVFIGTNDRGATVRIGRKGGEGTFTPVELLRAAVAGCVLLSAESVITRRTGDGLSAQAGDVRLEDHGHLDSVPVSLDYDVSLLNDQERAELQTLVERAIERQCTVTHTLRAPTSTPLAFPN